MGGSGDSGDWIMDGHGHVVARVTHTEHPLIDHLNINNNDSWKEIAHYDASGDGGAGFVGLNAAGTALVRFAYSDKSDKVELLEVSKTDASEKTIYANPQFDVSEALTDPWTGRAIGYVYIDDKPEYVFLDPKMQAMETGLQVSFPGLIVRPVSWDVAVDKVIFSVSGPRSPEAFYLLDRTTHQATPITHTYPELTAADLGEERPYPYTARDGVPISAYLTLPPGKPLKNLPAVIFPHGGPVARDEIGYDYMAQFFANRGYVVLQPNFRGSSGYGHKFTQAGYGQWGLKMQDDITDGVKKLIADGIADPKRICIVGASYGGYAALAGAAFTPDLYACAISWAGISDVGALMRDESDEYGHNSSVMSQWKLFAGDRFKDAARIQSVSPLYSVSRIKCPILLMHGTKDTTVPLNQSQLMRDALESAGKPVEYIAIEGDTHYLETASTRTRFFKEAEAFLAKYIGN
jgi:dipeptidyl aminopeptidase/acylaminoacyl peptidase